MIRIRPAGQRGHADLGWLDSWHTFSFGEYHDPAHMGFRSLRVMNEDVVGPGGGFPEHGHRDMEILTFLLAGELEHRDSLGHGEVLRPGQIQRMSAGLGIRHSEFNPSATASTHLYQVWILPGQKGQAPGYEQRDLPPATPGAWRWVATPTGGDGAVTIHQDARVAWGAFGPGQTLEHVLRPGRGAWLQVLRGRANLEGRSLGPGDGAEVVDQDALALEGVEAGEALLFDLA